MKATRLILLAITAVFAGQMFADAAKPAKAEKRRPKMSREELHAHITAKIASEGGYVDCPIRGKVVRIKVDSEKVAIADVEKEAGEMRRLFQVAVDVTGKGVTSTNKVGALILLADQGPDKPTLLCAPEDFWATVNVSRLQEGNPDAETFKSRVIKELWRAAAYALGAANSTQQPCVMRPIRGVEDLDAQRVAIVSPGPLMAIKSTLGKLHFSSGGRVLYRKACELGWAPAPTNDVQKAIWDKVHQLPTDPIKIKYDPKRDK